MEPRIVIRWSGLATIAFGVLIAAADVLGLALDPVRGSALHVALGTLGLAGFVLGIFAVTGIYARHARATGAAALAGYALAVAGLVLTAGNTMFFTFVEPWMAEEAPALVEGLRSGAIAPPIGHVAASYAADVALVGGIVLLIGSVARVGVLPRAALWTALSGGILAVLGGYVLPVLATLGVVVLGAGAAWLGYALWAEPTDAGK